MSSIKKFNSKSQIKFNLETIANINNITPPPIVDSNNNPSEFEEK